MAKVGAHRKIHRSSRVDAVLPVELWTHIFQYLPPASLRHAAGVSRLFYARACDAGLCIHRSFALDDPPTFSRKLAAFNDLVKHALPKNLRLGLSFRGSPSTSDGSRGPLDSALLAIRASMPLLSYLSINMSDNIDQANAVLRVLRRHPLPRLRKLEIRIHRCALSLPRDFLAGQAPLLRELTLCNLTLDTSPLPAFSNVRSLSFVHDAARPDVALPVLKLAHHFPNLSALSILTRAVYEPNPWLRFDLTRLSLRALSVQAEMLPAARRAMALDSIAVLRCYGGPMTVDWLEPADDTADFSLRLFRHRGDVSVAVVPAHRSWCRVYDVTSWHDRAALPLALADSDSDKASRLTYVRADGGCHLHALLASGAAEFPALRAIQVDVCARDCKKPGFIWPPDTHRHSSGSEHRTAPWSTSLYDVPVPACPALQKLTIFALDRTARVSLREVASLGRALGMPERETAALVLVGVEFAELVGGEFAEPEPDSEALALIGLTFSVVHRHALAGRDLEDGLWDDAMYY